MIFKKLLKMILIMKKNLPCYSHAHREGKTCVRTIP